MTGRQETKMLPSGVQFRMIGECEMEISERGAAKTVRLSIEDILYLNLYVRAHLRCSLTGQSQ
jgi:hypothetical protein